MVDRGPVIDHFLIKKNSYGGYWVVSGLAQMCAVVQNTCLICQRCIICPDMSGHLYLTGR